MNSDTEHNDAPTRLFEPQPQQFVYRWPDFGWTPEFYGVDLALHRGPEVAVLDLSDAELERLEAILADPKPPTQALRDLMAGNAIKHAKSPKTQV